MDPTKWTIDQVIDWLSEKGLGEYVKNFRDSGIDGTALLSEYFDENIQKELVPRIKDRITLKKVLHELKNPVTPNQPMVLSTDQPPSYADSTMNASVPSSLNQKYQEPIGMCESQTQAENECMNSTRSMSTSKKYNTLMADGAYNTPQCDTKNTVSTGDINVSIMDDQDVATSVPSSASANSHESTVSKTQPSPKTSETTVAEKDSDLFVEFQNILNKLLQEFHVPMKDLNFDEVSRLLFNEQNEALAQIKELLIENDYVSFSKKFLEHPQINEIWKTKKIQEKGDTFKKFQNELKLLWKKYNIDDELEFNHICQQLFDGNMNVLDEIRECMILTQFKSFTDELNTNELFKEIWQTKMPTTSNSTHSNMMEFKTEMIKLFQSENIQLDPSVLEELLENLYKTDDQNITDFFKNILSPKKIKQFLVKLQSNDKLKTIWSSNMLIFTNIKRILTVLVVSNTDDLYKLISELYFDSQNGMKLIESKCTNEIFNKIKSDLYRDSEIRSKVFHEADVIIPTNVHDNKHELSVITKCVQLRLHNPFQLENLVQAGELQYIDQTLKVITEKLVTNHSTHHCTFPVFIQDCLIPIMYFLKRLQNLDDFMNALLFKYQREKHKISNQSNENTNLSLRMLIHVLFMSSDIFLRRIIMSLASKRNPVPFISPVIMNQDANQQYEVMPAIIHVWNYSRPTILSFGIGSCQGKSSLLNQLFKSAFEQRNDSVYFQGTIDIDFGYCFNPERILNIADTHGTIDKKLLQKIQSIFDGFLIHIDKTYFDKNPQNALEYIEILSPDKFQFIIIRDVPTNNLNECSSKIQALLKQSKSLLSQKLHVYPLINSSNTTDRDTSFAIQYLREEILRKITEDIQRINNKADVISNLHKLMQPDYVQYLQKMDRIIQPLKEHLLEKNERQNEQNFPLYLKFKELCKLRQQLKRLDFYGSESENMFEINKKLFKLESELDPPAKRSSDIQCGYVFELYINVLKSTHMLMSLDLLGAELKSALTSLGGDKIAGNLKTEHAFLSLEVLWRNSIICHDHTSQETQKLIQDSYYEFVAAGFPFEIIDGDNFCFQHRFLSQILRRFSSKRILVISIIGPQNSGKSTLLNYMFGTLFDVREGRCTRGIYGSLVKLPKLDQTRRETMENILDTDLQDIDYMMLIDTEGILSIEKADKEYERRLVLFCLAVSHLVIVNMMGDINEPLKDMLTLCADSLKQIGVNKVNQPIIHFVLNQKADPNLKNHGEAIDIIIDDLRGKGLAEIIDINPKTFHTLPSAFKKENISNDTSNSCFLRTESDFIERTQKLCKKVIESAKSAYGRCGEMFSDPSQWLKTAVNIFDTLQKFPDLTYFKDINERRQDDQIRKEISDLISATLSATYREKMIRDTCELTEYDIRSHFQAEFDVHQDNCDTHLENIFKITNASDRIRDRSRQFLKRQVTEIRNAWCTAAIQAHDQKQMEGLIKDGSADLRKFIDDIIKRGTTMNKEEATEEFEKMWGKKIESIKKNFNPEERLKQAIKFVYGNYNIFEKQSLPTHDFVLQNLQLIQKLIEIKDMRNVMSALKTKFNNATTSLQRHALEVCHKSSDANVAYTLTTLHNFKHSRKEMLTNLHAAGSVEEKTSEIDYVEPDDCSSQGQPKNEKKRTRIQQGVNYVTNFLGISPPQTTSNKTSAPINPTPLPFDYMKATHEMILNELDEKSPANSNIVNISKFFDKILQEVMTIVHGNDAVPRPIEIDIVQKIVGLLNTDINEINLELLVFRLLLSKQTKSNIHLFVLILLTIFYYNEQKKHFIQQLDTLEAQKSSLLNYFISMVVPDAQCDQEGALLFATQVKNTIQVILMSSGQKIIVQAVRTKQIDLNRKQIQTICDGQLQVPSTTNEWLLRYIQAPTDIIVDEFQNLWDGIEQGIDQQIEKEKQQWRHILVEFFIRIEFIFSSLANEGSSVQYIDDIFEALGGLAADNLINKGQCMALLLYNYLSGGTIETDISYTVRGNKYTLKPKGSILFQKLPPPTTKLADVIKSMKGGDGSTDSHMIIASIKNLHKFLESIINAKKKILEDDYDGSFATFAAFDKDQIYNKLLDKARGCTSKCPCCDRPCDVDHSLIKSNPGDEDNRHACQTGHQLRAMAGTKFEVSNEASLSQCEQMEDSKPIIVRGTKKSWLEFKQDHPQWDFGNSLIPDDLHKLRSKFLHVWGKIGKLLCEQYDMKFVTHNTPQAAAAAFHYILLLDASGSMNGTPWNALLQAVKEFIKIRIDSGAADRITIIVFDRNAKCDIFNVEAKAVDFTKIKYTGGGTDFSKAFELVVTTIKNIPLSNSTAQSAQNLPFIIIFMTDGQASHPDKQLDELLTMRTRIHQFRTVAFGAARMDLLKKINEKMGGIFKELKTLDELINVYAEIARN